MESAFKNEEVLDPEYLPEILPFRENQIKLIANNLLPLAYNKKPRSMIVYGPPGVGKTATVRFVFRELAQEGIKTVYINCWTERTAVSILSKIVLSLGFFVARRGWSKDEIMKRLIEAINKTPALAICLDEVDKAKQEIFYDLLRLKQYTSKDVGYVFISNSLDFLWKFDARIRSSFLLEDIEFKPYNLGEMEEILKQRADAAFYSYQKEVVKIASAIAVKKGGDVRVGLELLRRAGLKAWERGSKRVEIKDIKEISSRILNPKKQIIKEKNLKEREKELLAVLSYKYEEVSKIYQRFLKLRKVSKRMLYKYLKQLESLGVIKIKKEGKKFLVKKI